MSMRYMSVRSVTSEETARAWVESRCSIALHHSVLKELNMSGLIAHEAKEAQDSSIVNVKTTLQDGTKRTLLHCLILYPPIKNKLISHLSVLLEFGADVNAQDVEGNTALMLAVTNPDINYTLIKALLEYPKTSLRVQDKEGRTALYLAVATGNNEAVRLIADEIVHRNLFSVFLLRSASGETAEEVAVRKRNKKCQSILAQKRLKLLEDINKDLKRRSPSATTKHLGRLSLRFRRAKTPELDPMAKVAFARRALARWETAAHLRRHSQITGQLSAPLITRKAKSWEHLPYNRSEAEEEREASGLRRSVSAVHISGAEETKPKHKFTMSFDHSLLETLPEDQASKGLKSFLTSVKDSLLSPRRQSDVVLANK